MEVIRAKAAVPKDSAEGTRQRRERARAEGKCGVCMKRPAESERKCCTECLNKKSNRQGEPDGVAGDPIDGRLAAASPDEKCYCGAKVAFAGTLFCKKHGREYVADLKRRFQP